MGVINDANTLNTIWCEVQRTNTTIDSISLNATTAIVSGKDFVVGNTAQLNATANRGNITANGSTDSVFQLATGGTRRAYLYHSGGSSGELRLINEANGAIAFGANATVYLTLTNDGRLYGSALHNNSGSVTGTTNQYVASGTYTPTTVTSSNVDSETWGVAQWIRVGNVVTVSGLVTINANTTGVSTTLEMTLPIASNITGQNQVGGTSCGAEAANMVPGRVDGIAANDSARIAFIAVGTTDTTHLFHYTYVIL
jgi:hypothetical protein